MIPVGRLAPGEQWDQSLIDDLFENRLYPTGLEFKCRMGYPNEPGCVLVVPGRYWHQHTDQITNVIKRYDWCLGIRVGDEEDLFDIREVEHPNLKWWVQTARPDRDYGDARLIPLGYTPHFRNQPAEPPTKDLPVFLSGQNTHQRRKEAFSVLSGQGWVVEPTAGFTQGYTQSKYAAVMRSTRVAPCPSGPASPESFRVYEALEAHCVPVADDVTPAYESQGFWRHLFPDVPFPVYTDSEQLPGYCRDQLEGWPANANRISAWWMRQKREMTYWLKGDLKALGAL